MTRSIREHDWGRTPLGSLDRWPSALRNALALLLDHPLPMALAWGPERTALYNDAYRRLLGARENVLGCPFLDLWAEARDTMAPQLARALAGEAVRANAELRISRGGCLELAFFDCSFSPVRDETGAVSGVLHTAIDISSHVLAERRHALVAELQHRTFNLMSMVQALADATIRSSASLEEFGPAFRDRIDALARVQRLLSRRHRTDRVTFEELLRGELEASDALDHARVTLDGPSDVALTASTLQALAMAIHELTMNARKYGALHQQNAHLDVRWCVDLRAGDPWLRVEWRESGVAMPSEGERSQRLGQGRMWIDKALPYQLRAETTYVLLSDGIQCSIALPMSARTVL